MKDTRDISSLHEWKDNPRNITPKDFERLKGQIKKLGQYKPLLVTKDGEVIGGNMRLKAYKELGITDVWVSEVNPKDENEKLEYALSDNDRAGYYDDDMLANLIPNYDIDWSQYAVDLKAPQDIQQLVDSLAPIEEDEAPEVSNEPAISKLGEVYQLGRHRLMCGDSTKIEDVEKLMDGQKADMVFTDPPYGIDLDTDYSGMPSRWDDTSGKVRVVKTNKYRKVEGDSKPFDATFILKTFKSADIFLWGADYYANTLPDSGIKGTWYVWDKREDISGDTFDNMFGSPFEMCWAKKKRGKEFIRMRWTGLFGGKAVEGERPHERFHPTQKPVSLSTWFYKKFSKEGNIIVDLYLGSGSFLLGAEQTNRICYGMELDEQYCDVIRKRYAKFIGKEDEWQTITPVIQ